MGQPGIALAGPDPEREVTGTQHGGAPLLVVNAGAAPELRQEEAEVALGGPEVLGVEGAEHLVAGHAGVEPLGQAFEKGHPPEPVVQRGEHHLVQGNGVIIGSVRRGWLVAAGLLVGTACSACGGSAGLSSTTRQSFLNTLYSQAPDIGSYRTGPQLVTMGQAVCADLEAGANIQEVADRVPLSEGSVALPTNDLGVLMSAAVGTICPKFRDLIGQ
jgi:Protein of unknown function (DUF732)